MQCVSKRGMRRAINFPSFRHRLLSCLSSLLKASYCTLCQGCLVLMHKTLRTGRLFYIPWPVRLCQNVASQACYMHQIYPCLQVQCAASPRVYAHELRGRILYCYKPSSTCKENCAIFYINQVGSASSSILKPKPKIYGRPPPIYISV